jgi:hypothetical protein
VQNLLVKPLSAGVISNIGALCESILLWDSFKHQKFNKSILINLSYIIVILVSLRARIKVDLIYLGLMTNLTEHWSRMEHLILGQVQI